MQKKIKSILLLALVWLLAVAPSFAYTVQYWFDNDDSNARRVSHTALSKIDVSRLEEGVHYIHILLFDNDGSPASLVSYPFVKETAASTYNFWVDNETEMVKTISGSSKDITSTINASKYDEGVHYLRVQHIDANGNSSPIVSKPFVKDAAAPVVDVWFDNTQTLSAQISSTGTATVNVAKLAPGMHTVHLSPRTPTSTFSAQTRHFVKDATTNVYYWVDDDSDSRTLLDLSNGNITLASKTLGVGEHNMNVSVETENGEVMDVISCPIIVEPKIYAYEGFMGRIGKEVEMVNNSPVWNVMSSMENIMQSTGQTVEGVTADGKATVFIEAPKLKEGKYQILLRPKTVSGAPIVQNLNEKVLGNVSNIFYDNVLGKRGFTYQAPVDFFSEVNGPMYKMELVLLEVGEDGLSTKEIQTTSLDIHRAGVVFVHGLTGSDACFEKMEKYLVDNGKFEDDFIYRVDYQSTNTYSFYENTFKHRVVENGCSHLYSSLLTKNKILSAKYDLVGHSMGGILSRKYIQDINEDGAHKIITVNTPHFGSNLGKYKARSWWERYKFKKFWKVFVNCEANDDLRPGSTAIRNLGVLGIERLNKVPVHAICSVIDLEVLTAQYDFSDKLTILGHETAIPSFKHVSEFTYERESDDLFSWLLDSEESDGIVSKESQMGGLKEPDHATVEHKKEYINYLDNSANQSLTVFDSEAFHSNTCEWSVTESNVQKLLCSSTTDNCFSYEGFGSLDYDNNARARKASAIEESGQFKDPVSSDTFISIKGELTCENDSNILTLNVTKSGDITKTLAIGSVDELYYSANDRDLYRFYLPDLVTEPATFYVFGRTKDYELVVDSFEVNVPQKYEIESIEFETDSMIVYADNKYGYSVFATWSNGEKTRIEPETLTCSDTDLVALSNDDDDAFEVNKSGICKLTAQYKGKSATMDLYCIEPILTLAGDVDKDDAVTVKDMVKVIDSYSNKIPYSIIHDVDNDGRVTLSDVKTILDIFLGGE